MFIKKIFAALFACLLLGGAVTFAAFGTSANSALAGPNCCCDVCNCDGPCVCELSGCCDADGECDCEGADCCAVCSGK